MLNYQSGKWGETDPDSLKLFLFSMPNDRLDIDFDRGLSKQGIRLQSASWGIGNILFPMSGWKHRFQRTWVCLRDIWFIYFVLKAHTLISNCKIHKDHSVQNCNTLMNRLESNVFLRMIPRKRLRIFTVDAIHITEGSTEWKDEGIRSAECDEEKTWSFSNEKNRLYACLCEFCFISLLIYPEPEKYAIAEQISSAPSNGCGFSKLACPKNFYCHGSAPTETTPKPKTIECSRQAPYEMHSEEVGNPCFH